VDSKWSKKTPYGQDVQAREMRPRIFEEDIRKNSNCRADDDQ